jgi:hypothetical protein
MARSTNRSLAVIQAVKRLATTSIHAAVTGAA